MMESPSKSVDGLVHLLVDFINLCYQPTQQKQHKNNEKQFISYTITAKRKGITNPGISAWNGREPK